MAATPNVEGASFEVAGAEETVFDWSEDAVIPLTSPTFQLVHSVTQTAKFNSCRLTTSPAEREVRRSTR